MEIVANTVGAENVYIFQWTAEGCSFKGDSRRYLNAKDVPDGVKFVMLPHNMKDGDLDGWKAACLKRVVITWSSILQRVVNIVQKEWTPT